MSTLSSMQDTQDWLHSLGAVRLCADSRKIQPGDVFIAWPGFAVDARQFVPSALNAGAVGALVEANGPTDVPSAMAYTGLKAAAGDIASAFYGHPSQHLNVVAFTGTNGKTSSSWWLAQGLDNLTLTQRQTCAIVGTLGTGMMGALESNGLTTPDPVLLQTRLKTFVEANCKVVALEASSIGISEGRLNGTRLHTAVFTNFTQDHLDYHGSMEAYWQAKASLFDWPGLKAAVINIDDPQGLVLCDRLGASQAAFLDIWTVALERPARLQAHNVRMTQTGLAFDVFEANTSHSPLTLQTALIGRYNVSNLLGVIAAMRSLGIALAECVKACEQTTAVPGRLEVIQPPISNAGEQRPMVVVDYAHTPDALEKVLLALREMATTRGGKLWCVFGCGGDRDASKRPLMGATARSYADEIVVTSDNPRSESATVIISQILLGLEQANVQVQADRAQAIVETICQANACDVIVIAGKGHENYQEIAGVKYPFSDQTQALAALALWRATA